MLRQPRTLGSIPAPARFDLDEHRTGVYGGVLKMILDIDSRFVGLRGLGVGDDIESASRRSAPGHDGFPCKVYNNLEGEADTDLLVIINKIWEAGELPTPWKHSIVVRIPKPGKSATGLIALRPISLTPTMGKISERMIDNVSLGGRRPTISITPTKLDSANISERKMASIALPRKSYICHLVRTLLATDISKAYDNIAHAPQLKAIAVLGLPPRVTNALHAFITDRTFAARLSYDESSNFP
ncbi:hypothetical protein HPB47_026130 [Ixodes persulcatus]|uniref:Uncharacterized protein n=1 Tax=Ixodes persulcatus TaxID=34615 RepID=A0AC60Q1E9_IXOPE|nr:hypothetical protein HPB47_026130 [Ixodes persulcatus]